MTLLSRTLLILLSAMSTRHQWSSRSMVCLSHSPQRVGRTPLSTFSSYPITSGQVVQLQGPRIAGVTAWARRCCAPGNAIWTCHECDSDDDPGTMGVIPCISPAQPRRWNSEQPWLPWRPAGRLKGRPRRRRAGTGSRPLVTSNRDVLSKLAMA